jgi:hypothetical protein
MSRTFFGPAASAFDDPQEIVLPQRSEPIGGGAHESRC